MNIGELGEFGLIELLREDVSRALPDDAALLAGIGDDAAVWHAAGQQIATVDTLIEGVHFKFEFTSWEQLGWKALAVNLSDIAAMGGRPRYALIALALPGTVEVRQVRLLYRGLLDAADIFGVAIVGGNVSSAPQVSLTGTLIGEATGETLLRRDSAAPGDSIAVTGRPGNAVAGLATLTEPGLPREAAGDHLREAFLRPYPRVREGQTLLKCGVRCAIDLSDGLAADLGHITDASDVGADIHFDRLPQDRYLAQTFGTRAMDLVLHGGEDYELLFTAPLEIIREVTRQLSCPVSVIGEVTPGEGVSLIDAGGQRRPLAVSGWDHFKQA